MDPIIETVKGKMWMYVVFGVTEVVGVLVVILTIAWCEEHLEGFAWDGSVKHLNYHILFMIIGMVFLYGNSIIIYRVLTMDNKLVVKLVHTTIHTLSILFIILGLVSAFDFHEEVGLNDMYSLHSWMGLISVLLFMLQFALALVVYLVPQIPVNIKARLMPVHRYMGVAIFVMVLMTVISGLNSKLAATGSMKGRSDPKQAYSELPDYAQLGNVIGLSVALYAIGVGMLLANPEWKRKEPEAKE